ncbi:hypothetical protein LCGC14_0479560 [marine sediment metagenome]|uniref:Uncharacterized protein n=1 Tax=marine sediment metagenome TaxID=412755 RepID=A0A0F9S9R7_9ZZZZ
MIHDPIEQAICLTVLGLEFGRDYYHGQMELYRLQGADGTDFILKTPACRHVFSSARDASEAFVQLVWNRALRS